MNIITKQKETYINHAMCECGGEFKYNNEHACGDIFGMFFQADKSNESYQFSHKCNNCGKEEKFSKMYPETIDIERTIDQESETVKYVQNVLNK